MLITNVLTLFDYNYWANHRVLEAAEKITSEQFTAPAKLSHGSVRGALAHILAAEIVWRLRCQEGISPSVLPGEADFPTLESLRLRWAEEERAIRAYLTGLTDEMLNSPVRYTTTKGVPQATILWQVLAHVVNHGTQFRAEAGVTLSQFGHSPGDLDFIHFIRMQS